MFSTLPDKLALAHLKFANIYEVYYRLRDAYARALEMAAFV